MDHWGKTRVFHLSPSSCSNGKRIWALPPPPPPFKSVVSLWRKKTPAEIDYATNYWRDLYYREMMVQRLEGVYELASTPSEGDTSPLRASKKVSVFLMSWSKSHLLEEINPDGDCSELTCLHCGPAKKPNAASAPMDLGSGSFAIRLSVTHGSTSFTSARVGTFSVGAGMPDSTSSVRLIMKERFRRNILRGVGSSTRCDTHVVLRLFLSTGT